MTVRVNQMDNVIFVKQYSGEDEAFGVNKKEIFRYAGYSGRFDPKNDQVEKLLSEVIDDCKDDLSYRVCYRIMDLSWEQNSPQLPFGTDSKNLAKCLEGSSKVIIFAATIGLGIDRKIARYQRISPSKALLLQAYGAERVECLCDAFCKEIGAGAEKEGLFCTPRFSPGYGDLPLDTQRDIFKLLECSVKIGVTLNDSLLMTPSKSVTAVFGLRNTDHAKLNKCEMCTKTDCLFQAEKEE